MEGDTLTIQAERKAPNGDATFLLRERAAGHTARSFVLPNTVDGSKCEAKYEQGVLRLTLPRREEARPRTIDVKVS